MKKWLCMIMISTCCLTACQKSPDTTTKEYAGTDGTAEAEVSAAEADYTPAIAEGYQFVEGLGICEPGNPVFYQLDGSPPIETANEYANVRLTDVFYQDKLLVVTIALEDHSISIIPANEVELLLEKEQENRKKQERGDAVTWDNSYVCIDADEKIYGRSKLWAALNNGGPARSDRLVDGKVYPAGRTESGYGFSTGSSSTTYKEHEDGWVSTVSCVLQLRGVPFTKDELGETFELRLDGFEQPLRFQVQKAKEAASLEELPGYTGADDMSFLVYGAYGDQELTVSCYPYREDDNFVNPVTAEVSYRAALEVSEKSGEMRPNTEAKRPDAKRFTGMNPSGMRQFTYPLPGNHEIKGADLILNQISVTSDEESGIYPIPIPDTTAALDLNVEFADGILYLTDVSRMPDGVSTGFDEDGGAVVEPGVYLTAHAEAKAGDRHLSIVYGYYADDLSDDGEMTRHGRGFLFPDTTDKPWYECEVQGYQIAYEPGADEVDILFWNPTYLLDQQFVLPVYFDAP